MCKKEQEKAGVLKKNSFQLSPAPITVSDFVVLIVTVCQRLSEKSYPLNYFDRTFTFKSIRTFKTGCHF